MHASPRPAPPPPARGPSAPTTAAAAAAPAADAPLGAGNGPDGAPKLDGRRVHVVDRALDYAALAARGMTAVQIARKRRKSAGYVSILLRLGRAIAGLEPAELAALRSPRVTWKLAQRVVRADADAGSIRHQLRLALGGFSTHNVDRRKHRAQRGSAGAGGAAPGAALPRPGAAWGWDEAWFTRDPVDYVRHHAAHLATVHRAVATRAASAVAQRAARRLSVGQSLALLQRSLAAAAAAPAAGPTEGPGSGAAERALAALAVLEEHLAAASREMARLLEPADSARPTPAPHRPVVAPASLMARPASSRPMAARLPTAGGALPFELDEDLAG